MELFDRCFSECRCTVGAYQSKVKPPYDDYEDGNLHSDERERERECFFKVQRANNHALSKCKNARNNLIICVWRFNRNLTNNEDPQSMCSDSPWEPSRQPAQCAVAAPTSSCCPRQAWASPKSKLYKKRKVLKESSAHTNERGYNT